MRFLPAWSRAVAAGAAVWVASFMGCAEDEQPEAPQTTDVVLVGGTNEEALEAFLARTPVHDPTKTAIFDWPSEGEQLPADTPSSFCWYIGEPQGARRSLPVDLARPPVPDTSPFEPLFFGLPRAHAQALPLSGPAYFITFADPDGKELLRGFTTATNFVPSQEAWAELYEAGVPITVTVTWADFEANRIPEGGGPWAGKPMTVGIRQY